MHLRATLPALLLLLAACPTADDDDSATPDPGPSICELNGWTERAFSTGPYGLSRHDVIDDFTLPLVDEDDWVFSERWTGCESHVFVPDSLSVSQLDSTSLWESDEDVAQLIEDSPRNVHYFFVSHASDSDTENERTEAMRERIDGVLEDLEDDDAAWWGQRLHVLRKRRSSLDNQVEDILEGIGREGFAIDRFQEIRGVGSLADVGRFSAELNNAGAWPWESNLAWIAHEPIYFNFESDRQDRLDAQSDVTIVNAWSDVVLSEFEEAEVTFPDAATMATFDTLEIDLYARCPETGEYEFNNCGAWDYIANLFLWDEASETWTELSRWITTYHREGRYLVDATPALVHLAEGGTRRIKYSFAPSWNVQPTWTHLDFRFRDAGVGHRPTASTYLYGGGSFNSAYNDDREPVDVEIPAGAAKVELWSIITGHGMDAGNCAEFCNHQHEFTVDGEVFLKDWPAVGDDEGCADTVDSGTVPNQAGTWFFGRGGWCPGRQVDPWVVDVTDVVTAGGTATVSYRGLLGGSTPPDNSGSIHMNSWLVVYE